MNIAHDQKTCQKARMTGHPQGRAGEVLTEFGPPLEWQDLRSRLFAAHEARSVLCAEAKPLRLRLRGSFDGCAASAVTTYKELSRIINLDASSYRKPGETKISPVAGISSTGRRG